MLMSQAWGRNAHFRKAKFKPPKCPSFLFVFVAFYYLYNVFHCFKIELQNSKTKAAIQISVKKAALVWIHKLLNLFDHK